MVNALLTQLDKLKQRRNVLVMSTSNLAKAIGEAVLCPSLKFSSKERLDSAYVDRADIVQYVGLPATEAVYTILASCINELGRTGIVSPVVSALFT